MKTSCFLSWTQQKVSITILILVTDLLLVPFLCDPKLLPKKPEIVLVMLRIDLWTLWHLVVQDSPSGSKEHPTIPDKPELKDLTGALNKVASEWKRLGVNLEIPEGMLNNIAADYPHKSEDCLLEMLKEWLKRQDAPPSWATIVDAVESLGYKQLGSELKEKYRIPWPKKPCIQGCLV